MGKSLRTKLPNPTHIFLFMSMVLQKNFINMDKLLVLKVQIFSLLQFLAPLCALKFSAHSSHKYRLNLKLFLKGICYSY